MSNTRRVRRWAGAAMAILAIGTTCLLAAGPDVKVELQGTYRPSDMPEAKWASLQDDTKVVPGDRILYNVRISNQGDRDARRPVAFGPVPAGTSFVPGTATRAAGLEVEYSIDGGKTFFASPTITIPGKDGKPETVPAPPERYTTLRWTWESPLPAGSKAGVSYQVQVR